MWNSLPRTPDTLWFRLLGRGKVQIQAVNELVALPRENLLRRNVLEIIYRWRIGVMTQTDLTLYDQELIMNLTEAYHFVKSRALFYWLYASYIKIKWLRQCKSENAFGTNK